MAGWEFRLRGKFCAIHRRLRELEMIARGLLSANHPILAHLIAIRRCNLSCAYCNEYDRTSPPVPLETLHRRIDRLAELGTAIVTASGGEPLLHLELESVIARIRRRGMIAGLITNGYLLTGKRIERLNQAGLDHMQISIDNAHPDEVSKKSLKVLDRKLELLAGRALFHVNINSVVGGGIRNPKDALAIGRRAVELGFTCTAGIIHDGDGRFRPLQREEKQVYLEMKKLGKSSYAQLNSFQDNLADGQPNDWRCRAGARYLYICEDGLVHYCSQQRGYPAKPLDEYTLADIRREFVTEKSCAPSCTISCVHQVSSLDFWRGRAGLRAPAASGHAPAGAGSTPGGVSWGGQQPARPQLIQIETAGD